jgi:nicotinate-nucleotide adenylyltransferase
VQALRAERPEDELALVIGADLVDERQRWHGWPTLKTLADFIIVGRGGYPGAGEAEVALPPVSSTEVRARIAAGRPVDSVVAADVVDYIRERGLYRGEP